MSREIKASDLRIDNFVSITQSAHKDDIEMVTIFMLKQIENGYRVFGIPLTEEILLKCVFKFKDKGFSDLSVSYGLATETIHFVIGNYYKKLNYLHELQNLYFALTNEELIVNL